MSQSETTRSKISNILQQVGMTDEELYQLLYGRKQQVEVDIAMPQLLDEDLWLETEHTPEEMAHLTQQVSALERIIENPPTGETLAALEALLEGELLADDARGFLLKKHIKNWRNGMSRFLAFLAFSNLQKMAISIATLTAPNLIAPFEQTKNRPQDRRMLADFIIKQIEQPLPPIIAIMAEHGAALGPTGSLEFKQPLTAALLQQSPEAIAKILKLLEGEQPQLESESPFEQTKSYEVKQRGEKTAALMNKLIVLDRVETLVANQQALQQPEQTIDTQQQQQQAQPAPRRPRGTRRALREAMERDAKEKTELGKTEAETPRTGKHEMHVQRTGPTPNRQQSPKPASDPMKKLFGDLKLDSFKGITASEVSQAELGKTKSSLPKDIAPQKPDPTLQR